MADFWDYRIWGTVILVSVLLLSLLLANLLKRKILFLRNSLIPTSVLAGVILHILRFVGTKAFGIAQDTAAKGVSLEEHGLEVVIDQFRWRVVVTLYLVDDNLHLLVHLLLRILTMKHHIEKQVHGTAEMLLLAGAVVHRLLLAREGIQVAAHTLHVGYYLSRCAPVRALEAQVLGKVRHAAFLVCLVPGASIQCQSQVHRIRRAGCINHTQTVV